MTHLTGQRVDVDFDVVLAAIRLQVSAEVDVFFDFPPANLDAAKGTIALFFPPGFDDETFGTAELERTFAIEIEVLSHVGEDEKAASEAVATACRAIATNISTHVKLGESSINFTEDLRVGPVAPAAYPPGSAERYMSQRLSFDLEVECAVEVVA